MIRGLIRGALTLFTMSLIPFFLIRMIRALHPNLEVFASIEKVVLLGLIIAVLHFIREIKGEDLGIVAGIVGSLLSALYVVILFSGPGGFGLFRISYGKVNLELNLRKYVFLILSSLGVGALIDLISLIRILRSKSIRVS